MRPKISADKLLIVGILIGLLLVGFFVLRRIGSPPTGADRSVFFDRATGDDLSRKMLSANDRAAVARELGRAKPPEAVNYLVPYLGDADPEVRIACAEALAEIGDRSAVPDLQTQLNNEQEARVRAALQSAIESMSDDSVARALGAQMASDDPAVRLNAIADLAPIRDNRVALGILVDALADPDPAVRQAASRELTQTSSLCFERLRQAAASASPQTAQVIVTTLERMQSSETVPVLLDVAAAGGRAWDEDQVEALRAAVLKAISKLGEPAVIPICLKAFEDGRMPVKQLAAAALSDIGGPVVVFQVRNAALKWESMPRPEELNVWLNVLNQLGGEDARQAGCRSSTTSHA